MALNLDIWEKRAGVTFQGGELAVGDVLEVWACLIDAPGAGTTWGIDDTFFVSIIIPLQLVIFPYSTFLLLNCLFNVFIVQLWHGNCICMQLSD